MGRQVSCCSGVSQSPLKFFYAALFPFIYFGEYLYLYKHRNFTENFASHIISPKLLAVCCCYRNTISAQVVTICLAVLKLRVGKFRERGNGASVASSQGTLRPYCCSFCLPLPPPLFSHGLRALRRSTSFLSCLPHGLSHLRPAPP